MRSTVVALFVGVALLVGCGGGGKGDEPSEPGANKLGSGSRLSELIGPADWLDPTDTESTSCGSPADRNVHVTGVTVVAIDRFDEVSDGAAGNHYVMDTSLEPLPYSGVLVFGPSFSPPDLRLAEGDVVDALGILMEFPGPSSFAFKECKTLPEVGGTLTFRYENGPRVPADITLDDLGNYETARPYLGMLVRLKNVAISGQPQVDGSGRYSANLDVGAGVPQDDVPKISNELYDVPGDGPMLANGTQIAELVGIVTFFHEFKIAPRSPEDIKLKP